MNEESIALRVQHIGLWVTDLERLSRFYRRVLGFEKQDSYHVPAKIMHHIFGQDTAYTAEVYRRDKVVLELFHSDQKMQDQGPFPLIPASTISVWRLGTKELSARRPRRRALR
ncbi:MAG: hypothetical protein AMJ92_03460 [candidate division Zixibacteria bacterium SM23_81]|nr:MAG: hypothetical protein AMJ92_03460 [candidate division Zixibacteria bacterium SM23_81]